MVQVGGVYEGATQPESGNLYENSNYHEECLKCNSCGVREINRPHCRSMNYLHFAG